MPVPTALVQIANAALALIYQPPITSLSDTNVPAASIMNNLIDTRRQYWLRMYLWNFARWRATILLVSGQTPAFDFENFYQLPNDFMRLDQIGSDWHRYNPLWFDIQGSYVCLNPTWFADNDATPPPSIHFKYQRDMPDPSTWSPGFTDVMILDLAVRACMPLTADAALLKPLTDEFTMTLRDAQNAENSDRPILVTEKDPIEWARRAASEIWQLDVLPALGAMGKKTNG